MFTCLSFSMSAKLVTPKWSCDHPTRPNSYKIKKYIFLVFNHLWSKEPHSMFSLQQTQSRQRGLFNFFFFQWLQSNFLAAAPWPKAQYMTKSTPSPSRIRRFSNMTQKPGSCTWKLTSTFLPVILHLQFWPSLQPNLDPAKTATHLHPIPQLQD